MRSTYYSVKLLCAIYCFSTLGQLLVEASFSFGIYYLYKNSENGQVIGPVAYSFGANGYDPGDAFYCNHFTPSPDNSEYKHGHVFEPFEFTNANQDVITQEKLQWGWGSYYAGFTKLSDETFLGNCYTYATDQPSDTIGTPAGYAQWTSASSQCEGTSFKKSFAPSASHVIVISATGTSGESSCVISQTQEKTASSGVYQHGWLPLGVNSDTVRKTRW